MQKPDEFPESKKIANDDHFTFNITTRKTFKTLQLSLMVDVGPDTCSRIGSDYHKLFSFGFLDFLGNFIVRKKHFKCHFMIEVSEAK